MGLVETMSTTGAPAFYDVGDSTATGFTITISVYGGEVAPEITGKAPSGATVPERPAGAGVRPLARANVLRQLPGPLVKRVQLRPDQPAADGLYADIFLPSTPTVGTRPGVVIMGGSGGGLSTALNAETLAAHGYPAMALAYFGAPGLPSDLRRIPLEYFATAVRHLAAQPRVDGEAIALMGWSRGSEAALLTGAYFPSIVKAVVGGSPGYTSNVDPTDLTKPSWTFQGKDLPTPSSQDYTYPNAASPATMPVERIDGPILLFCGQQDWLWPSCANGQALQQRLRARGRPAATLLSYPEAGHFVVSPLPCVPGTISGSSTSRDGRTTHVGGTYPADQAARADVWPRLIALLETMHTSH